MTMGKIVFGGTSRVARAPRIAPGPRGRRPNCWSYESVEHCLDTLKHHLKTSGLHAMSDEYATLVLDHANVIHERETLADRDHYRKQVAICQAETVIHDKGDHAGGNLGQGGKGGKGDQLGAPSKV